MYASAPNVTMKYLLFLLVLLTALSGCASQILKGYVGRDISSVVARYGPPENEFDLPDGRRAIQ